MKKSYLAVTAMVLMATLAMAQTEPVNPDPMPQRPMMGRRPMAGQYDEMVGWPAGQRWERSIPNLTEEQRQKIEALQTAHWKAVKPLQDELLEKQARLRTLCTADRVDRKALDSHIEAMGALQTRIRKNRTNFIQDVRGLLDENQRIWMDRRQGFGRGGRCIGTGMGTGRGFGGRGGRIGRGGRGGW